MASARIVRIERGIERGTERGLGNGITIKWSAVRAAGLNGGNGHCMI